MQTNKIVYLYALYDKHETIVFLGNYKEAAKYLNITPESFKSGISHAKSANAITEDGGIIFRKYTIYKFKEEDLNECNDRI